MKIWPLVLVCGVAAAEPPHELTKQELRPVIKTLVPVIAPCFNDAGSGVANLKLVFDGTPKRLTVALKGTDGDPLADEVRACVRETLAGLELDPIGDGGHAEVLYPFTYAVASPDNHDLRDFHRAERAADAKRWAEALAAAQRALKLTSLDGVHRRPLIRIAGIAACHLGHRQQVTHYESLASVENAAAIHAACDR